MNNDTRILVVDDEKYIGNIIVESLTPDGYRIHCTSDPQAALKYVAENPVDLVLTDLVMGDYSGIQVLEETLKHHRDAVVILMTAYPTVQTAISVLKKGAYDFLIKPFKLELLRATVRRGLQHQRVLRENLTLKSQVEFLKAANAVDVTADIDGYLKRVIESCRVELSASAAALLQIDPENGNLIRSITAFDDESHLELILDDSMIERFLYRRSPQPVVTREEIRDAGVTRSRVSICKPVFIGNTLHGVINLLIISRFDRVTPGQLDILSILTNSAASAMANQRLYDDVQQSYLQVIRALASAIEARDQYTAGHTDRVVILAEVLARRLGWNDRQIRNLVTGCTLHDIGKIGVPDSVLNKPQRLTDEERDIMVSHPGVGMKIIEGIELLRPSIPYIIAHHERYDGHGYPGGLKGKAIPVEGRLLAVVDTFDAILSDRPYRKGAALSVAVSELVDNKGKQFDPELVDLFLQLLQEGEVDLKELYDCDEDINSLNLPTASERVPG